MCGGRFWNVKNKHRCTGVRHRYHGTARQAAPRRKKTHFRGDSTARCLEHAPLRTLHRSGNTNSKNRLRRPHPPRSKPFPSNLRRPSSCEPPTRALFQPPRSAPGTLARWRYLPPSRSASATTRRHGVGLPRRLLAAGARPQQLPAAGRVSPRQDSSRTRGWVRS